MDNIELLQQRLTLLTQLPIVDFIPFHDDTWLEPEFAQPAHFKKYARSFWARQVLKNPGDFARLPVQSPGAVGQGATL